MAVSRWVDALGLITFEQYARAREQVISEQAEQLLELTTPVVKLWEGVVAVPLIGTLDSQRTQIVMRFERPDLVLLDLDIPPPDGQTVLAQMRQDPRLDDVPVVVVTSARLDAARHTALESAAILDKAQFSGSLLAAAADVASHLVRR